jgi:hypothetical protein
VRDREKQYTFTIEDYPKSVANGKEHQIEFTSQTTPPYKGTVQYFPNFELIFDYSLDGKSWTPLGSAQFCLYLTWKEPVFFKFEYSTDSTITMRIECNSNSGSKNIQETMLWLGCNNARGEGNKGKTEEENEQQILDTIFSKFETLEVSRIRDDISNLSILESGKATAWSSFLSLHKEINQLDIDISALDSKIITLKAEEVTMKKAAPIDAIALANKQKEISLAETDKTNKEAEFKTKEVNRNDSLQDFYDKSLKRNKLFMGYWRGISAININPIKDDTDPRFYDFYDVNSKTKPFIPRNSRVILKYREFRCQEWTDFLAYIALVQGIKLKSFSIYSWKGYRDKKAVYKVTSKKFHNYIFLVDKNLWTTNDPYSPSSGILYKSSAQGNNFPQPYFSDHVFSLFERNGIKKYYDASYGKRTMSSGYTTNKELLEDYSAVSLAGMLYVQGPEDPKTHAYAAYKTITSKIEDHLVLQISDSFNKNKQPAEDKIITELTP